MMKLSNPNLQTAFEAAFKQVLDDITLEAIASLEVLPVIGTRKSRIDLEPLDDLLQLRAMTTLALGFCDFQDLAPLQALPELYRLQLTHCDQASLEAIARLNIRELSCGRTGLESLKGVEDLPLHGITLEYNQITSLEPLHAHPNLKFCKADGNPLIELAALEVLHALEKLSLSHCADEAPGLFRDQLFYLQDKAKLQVLELAHNQLRDLRWLQEAPALHNLRTLDISGNTELRDFSALNLLTELRHLDLTVCMGLKDLSFVSHMPHLEVLELKLCQYIEDISPLYEMPSLKRINFDAVPLPSVDILAPLQARGVEVSYQESWIGASVPPAG